MDNIEKNLTPKNSIPISHFKTKGGNMIVITEEDKYDKEMKEFWKDKYFEMQDNYHNANEEIERLNNIRKEIRKYIMENSYDNNIAPYDTVVEYYNLINYIDKLEEKPLTYKVLKGSDKE